MRTPLNNGGCIPNQAPLPEGPEKQLGCPCLFIGKLPKNFRKNPAQSSFNGL
jgi:hypothetical protein